MANKIMLPCSTHRWAVPSVGDNALLCETCGCRKRFVEDVTPKVRTSYVTEVLIRQGSEAYKKFTDAFGAADEDAHRRAASQQRELDL